MKAFSVHDITLGHELRFVCLGCGKKMLIPSVFVMGLAGIGVPACATFECFLVGIAFQVGYKGITFKGFLVWALMAAFFGAGLVYSIYVLVSGVRNRLRFREVVQE